MFLLKIRKQFFFSSPRECVEKCHYYLNNENEAKKISRAGHIKITKILKPNHENLIKKVIDYVF